MTITPTREIAAPKISNLSGIIFSNIHPHRRAITIKMPPYAAYTLPKFAGCRVGIIP